MEHKGRENRRGDGRLWASRTLLMSANSQRRSGQVRAHGRLALRCFVRHVRARRRRAACRGRWWSGGESAVCVVCVLQPRFKHLHTASKFPKTRENKFAPASRRTHVQTTQNQAIVSLPPRRPSYCTPVALVCRPRQCKYLWFRLSCCPGRNACYVCLPGALAQATHAAVLSHDVEVTFGLSSPQLYSNQKSRTSSRRFLHGEVLYRPVVVLYFARRKW